MSVSMKKNDIDIKILQEDFPHRKRFEHINNEAFPDYERLSTQEIFAFKKDTDTDVLGIYHGDNLEGFMMILKNDRCGYVYFLAIAKEMRSKGYGGAALQKLKEMYPDIQIILDFEEVVETADNYDQRVRRKEFYLNNGFYETGTYTLLYKERFEVVCSKEKMDKGAFKELIHILHEKCPSFMDILVESSSKANTYE